MNSDLLLNFFFTSQKEKKNNYKWTQKSPIQIHLLKFFLILLKEVNLGFSSGINLPETFILQFPSLMM